MCNKDSDCSEGSTYLQSADHGHLQPAVVGMDSPPLNPASAPNSGDETPRVKFLCSFSGSILPRPQDGKLRYVGGETRIISVPRDISYEDLMARMRELYEGASILKYQQPDEDLDALVSVVNDDDVTNMMEEYDKLGSGDGFTRLRIFLFSHLDQDASPHYLDGDERETERRYVDALNSLNESPDYRRQQLNDSPVMTPVEESYTADQFLNSMNLDGSIHNQRNYEMPTPHYSLRHLMVPDLGSGHLSVSIPQRYGDDNSWSPAYYSPRCAPQGPTSALDVPSSPSTLYNAPYTEIPDRPVERLPEDYSSSPVNHQPSYDPQAQYSEKAVWLPTNGLPVEKSGFPGNTIQQPNAFEGSRGNCRVPYQRNQPHRDPQWKYEDQQQVERPSMGNGFVPVVHSCVDCPPNKEVLLNPDLKLQHGIYGQEQSDPRSVYPGAQNSERGWPLQHPLHPRPEESTPHMYGAGRGNEHYMLDSMGMNYPIVRGGVPDSHPVVQSHIQQEEPQYVRAGPGLGNEVLHGQVTASSSHIQVPMEERGVRQANLPYTYGVENAYQLSHGHSPAHSLHRDIPTPGHIPSAYDTSTLHPAHCAASPGLPQITFGIDPSPLVEPRPVRLGVEASPIPEYVHTVNAANVNSGAFYPETQQNLTQDCAWNSPSVITAICPQEHMNCASNVTGDKMVPLTQNVCSAGPGAGTSTSGLARPEERNMTADGGNSISLTPGGGPGGQVIQILGELDRSIVGSLQHANLNNPGVRSNVIQLVDQGNATEQDVLPDLVAFVNNVRLESTEAVKAMAQENLKDNKTCDASAKDVDTDTIAANVDDGEPAMGHRVSECGSDNDCSSASKIEPTKAEEEAIARGLQTIRNDDLEEIRELGSGTYGSVFHGKWKGSDVAIKRIKASCFAGRPSERERLIADFWKEALLLSSLHHPNVVSFYGVVRDGPDGSLATVTEFMVNGSLKQYLQKKDRTIDRRKRLIIAMDAAFGMEYLHGKNIVHFDLKCENLLVNMRDPHRPICKIGDLGLSKVKQKTLVSGGVRGTLPWMAPELLSGKSNMVTEKIDVYSFGIVMWELLTGDEPYTDMHCASIIGGIVNNTLRPQIPTWCDPEWKELMQNCWDSEPSKRPSFSEISQKLRTMAAAMNIK